MIGYGLKKVKETLSGWEKSHFGGYFRMINDYPYIKLDYDVKLEVEDGLSRNLGWYVSEKLIKLYLLKAQQCDALDKLTYKVVEETNKFTGQTEKYMVASLGNDSMYSRILSSFEELSPLFEHYWEGISKSSIKKRIPDEDQNQDGDGDGEEGDGNEEGKGTEGSSKLSEEELYAQMVQSMKQALKDIKEHEPYRFKSTLSGFEGKPVFKTLSPTKTYDFTRAEIRDAEHLVKLLDISFEPKSDVVKSLRAGKLDVCKIAEVPAGSTSIYKQIVEDQDTRPFTVCILADMSGSMNGDKLKTQKHVLNSLYLALSSIMPAEKLWIYGHTGDDEVEIYPFHTPYNTDYAKNISLYETIDLCQNYDGPVIEAIHKKVREATDDRVIFIMLSDGQPSGNGYGGYDDIVDMKRILERARRDDFVTVGLGIQYHTHNNLYVYSKILEDMNTLVKDVSHVINNVVRAEFK
jgi:nitric oxide reductase activation protein